MMTLDALSCILLGLFSCMQWSWFYLFSLYSSLYSRMTLYWSVFFSWKIFKLINDILRNFMYYGEVWGLFLCLWYQKLFSHVFLFFDPELFLCLLSFLSWPLFLNKNPFPSFPHLHHNLFSFLHLPGFCAAWKSHNVNECESVRAHLLEPLNHIATKPECFFNTPPNLAAPLVL